MMIHYFSYGSNMSTKRLTARVPSTRVVGTGYVRGHTLSFHKIGMDGSAKCDMAETAEKDCLVYGVLFEIDASEKGLLDIKEGLGNGYELKNVEVIMADGETTEAFTYYATNIGSNLKPFSWYKEHVVRGAVEHNLPEEYQRMLQEIEAMDDPDLNRAQKELQIYS